MTDQVTALVTKYTGDSSELVEENRVAGRSTRQYGDEVERTTKRTGAFTRATKESNKQIRAARNLIGNMTKAAVAGAAAVAGLTAAMVQSGLKSADALGRTADKLGVQTEALAALRLQAEAAGIETGKFDTALQRLTRRTAEAAAGTGEAQAAFRALGLDASALVKLAPDEILGKIADRMKTVENQSQRVALAFKLFDTEGVDLVNMLRDGSAGMEEFAHLASVAGLALDRETVAAIEAANDSILVSSKLFDGFSQQLAGEFAHIIQGVADDLFSAAEEAGGMGKVAEQVFNFLIKGSLKVVKAISAIRVAWNAVSLAFNVMYATVAKGWELLLTGIGKGVRFFNEEAAEPILRAAESFGRVYEDLAADVAEDWEDMTNAAGGHADAIELVELKLEEYKRRSRTAAESAVDDQETVQGAMLDTATVAERMGRTMTQSADAASQAWQRASQQISGALINNLGIGGGGFGGIFSSVLSGAVTSGVSSAGGVSGSSSLGFLGSLGAGASGVLSGFGGLATNAYRAYAGAGLPGAGIGARFLSNNAAFGARFGLSGNAAIGAGAIGSIGAGYLGGIAGGGLGSALSGKVAESNYGQIAGGVIGSIWGPIGSFVGSALGGLVDTLAGGDGKRRINVGVLQGAGANFYGDNSVGDVITGASGLSFQAVNRRGGKQGKAASEQFLAALLGLDQGLTAISRAAGINVDFSDIALAGIRGDAGKSGIGNFFGLKGFNGVEGSLEDSAREFVEAWLDEVNDELPARVREIMRGVDGTAEEIVAALEASVGIDRLLGLDVVRETEQALRELGNSSGTLFQIYSEASATVVDLAENLDGSVSSLTELNAALFDQKSLAVDLAVSYRALAIEADVLLGNTIDSIRESLLSEEELYALRRTQIADLTNELGTAVSPDQIASILQDIDSLSRSAFGLLDETQQQSLGQEFIDFLTTAADLAQDRINAGLANLGATEEGVANAIDFELAAQTQMSAAEIQQSAAERMENAASRIEDVFGNLNFNELNAL